MVFTNAHGKTRSLWPRALRGRSDPQILPTPRPTPATPVSNHRPPSTSFWVRQRSRYLNSPHSAITSRAKTSHGIIFRAFKPSSIAPQPITRKPIIRCPITDCAALRVTIPVGIPGRCRRLEFQWATVSSLRLQQSIRLGHHKPPSPQRQPRARHVSQTCRSFPCREPTWGI